MNGADTAFVLVSAALVMLMTPGLALFYGGMVRSKNILATLMENFILLGVVGVLWALYGYSLAFGPDGYLYMGLGDGGNEGDPLGNGQSLDTLLGKLHERHELTAHSFLGVAEILDADQHEGRGRAEAARLLDRFGQRRNQMGAVELAGQGIEPGEPAQFLVAGEGSSLEAMEHLAESLDVSDRVRFLGRVSQESLPKVYAACDVFVLPSLFETPGIAALEAALTGAKAPAQALKDAQREAARLLRPGGIIQVEAGRLELVLDWVDLGAAVTESVAGLRPLGL